MSNTTLLRAERRSQTHASAPLFRLIDRLATNPMAERQALVDGLFAPQPAIPPKYFYDRLGCALFGAICELAEYYPTRTERTIFTAHRDAIVDAAGRGKAFVDLGAGDCAKGEAWIGALAPARYLAVDIAADALEGALARMARRHPDVELTGVIADFTSGLDVRDLTGDADVLFFYPGSSIGNFPPEEARAFLASIRAHCRTPGSGLLIGVDVPKDPARLVAAYDDALGVTAAFNRNVMRHVNVVLGTAFDPAAFVHRATWDAAASRVQMWLEACRDQSIAIDRRTLRIAQGARIHTEDSYKYAPAAFEAMLRAAGFAHVRRWQDDGGDFAVFHAS